MLSGVGKTTFVGGPAGPPNTLSIHSVTTGVPGSQAAAQISGTAPNQVLDLTIPQGPVGPTGAVPWASPVPWFTGQVCVSAAPATLVVVAGQTYACTVSHIAGAFATDLAAGRWQLVAAQGLQPWKTAPVAWAAATGYSATAPADCVTYAGGCYVCTTSHVSGANFDPTKWAQIAAPGASNGSLIAANNLSDLQSARTALINIGNADSPVRHTVQSGPSASGAPSFLPASSGSLTLAFQNISGASPLVVTCAKGFPDGAGAQDAIAAFTANPSLTLAASATSYLYYDFDAAAWGSTPLQPILDQFGGAIATTNGQYTFDRQAMVGWLGNGSAAQRANRVFVGEAITSASAVTSATAYAYNGLADSGWTAGLPSAGSVTTKAHNLGLQPGVRKFIMECTSAGGDAGYGQGEQISSEAGVGINNGSYNQPMVLSTTRLSTSIVIVSGGSSSGISIPNKSNTGANAYATQGSWRWKLVAGRGW